MESECHSVELREICEILLKVIQIYSECQAVEWISTIQISLFSTRLEI